MTIILAGILPTLARAAASAGAATYTTIGNSDCSHWLERREEAASGKTYSFSASWFMEGWILGSVTTLNAAQQGKPNALQAIDADTIFLWVDKFCAKYPKKDLLDASFELIGELNKIETRKQNRKK
jgi:hypothetical protein